MICKLFRKVKNVICLIVMMCIIVPLVSACGGGNENNLTTSVKNKIGVGGSIQAYTTYSQAKFMEMDQDMYYSYLMNARDFILVVVPEDSDSGQPDMTNLMFQAAYNGVTPYAEQITEGNFAFSNPEYKLLIYYVLAKDFLAWEKEANAEEEKSFLSSALDFLGPSSTDVKSDTEKRMVDYTLKEVVNMNSYVSECDFLRVDSNYNIMVYNDDMDSTARTKCGSNASGRPNGKNVVADVAKGTSQGVTLLYGGGGLSGYFTYDQVKEYSFDNVAWIKILLNGGNLESYITNLMEKHVCSELRNQYSTSSEEYKAACGSDAIKKNAEQMSFKLQYDLALLGRISNINYYTLLDINTNTNVTTGINGEYKDNISGYNTLLNGTTSVNGGNYITFTTADGFIIDRGNIVMQAGADALLDTNILSFLTQIDACTNKTLGAYVAEILADVGMVVGGIAVGVGAAVLAAGVVGSAASAVVGLATAGAVSLSVPGLGWIIGGALLLAAGIAVLATSYSTKKAIEDTSSANYCTVFEDAIKQVIEMSYIKLPIYNYNIEKDPTYSTDLCYAEFEIDANGREVCPEGHGLAAFDYANVSEVEQLSSLTGMPSLRLYSNGRLVDEIYGASSTQYIYAIMDSWGVTAASSMKYYTGVNTNRDGDTTGFTVYDLLATAEEKNTIVGAKYCFSTSYGEECTVAEDTTTNNNFNNGSFRNAKYTIPFDSREIDSRVNTIINRIIEAENIEEVDFNSYEERLKTEAGKHQIPVYTEDDSKYILIGKSNDVRYNIIVDSERSYLEKEDDSSTIALTVVGNNYTFAYDEEDYKLFDIEDDEGIGYRVIKEINLETEEEGSLNGILNELDEKMLNKMVNRNTFITNLVKALEDGTSVDTVVTTYINEQKEIEYYNLEVPIYFTFCISEQNGEEYSWVNSSVLYTNVVISLKGGN